MLAGGRAGSWAAQRRRDPKASRQESGYIYLDLSYQGIKVKCDPKLGGSLITLCLPSLGRSGFLNGEGGVGGVALRAEIMHRTLLWLLAL